jgi:Spy/CpxP family protein refolding chaperone
MKKMRWVYTAVLLVFVVSYSVTASAQGVGLADIDGSVKKLKERLTLDSLQEQQVRTIMTETQAQLKKDRDESGGDRRKMFGILRERIAEMDGKIEAVLTDAQKPKYADYKKERDEEARERMRERFGR